MILVYQNQHDREHSLRLPMFFFNQLNKKKEQFKIIIKLPNNSIEIFQEF